MKDDFDATLDALSADDEAAGALVLAKDLEGRDFVQEILEDLVGRLPRFQYFDEYNILPGSVSVQRLQSLAEDNLDAGERTALALLRLASVDGADASGRGG